MLALRWELSTEKQFYAEVGRRIRRHRRRADMTLSKVAEKEGVTRYAVSHWERGTTHVSLHTLYRLAALFEVTPADLLPDPTAPWRLARER
jgi:transcriptional regulator with XRE-family HTH domain